MERAVYFDGWYRNSYCQHPSMPPRRLGMLRDLLDMEATILVWAGLGGGSISLPYLEEEAYGPVPARFRQHGYVTDAEFVAHARDRGIELFAIVFEAQAWELPAELVDGDVVAQTELRGAGGRATVGLREFSRGTGPRSWRPLRHYFPDGLVNSSGEEVTDLWQEVASRDLDGAPLHAHWVEVAGRDQACHYADRNNPVWQEYLRAVIRTQIDAGARAIQLDETETPMGTLQYGGCFCPDCVRGFRDHLQGLPAAELPPELDGVDLTTFDYRQWLRDRGHRARENPRGLPLYRQYTQFLQESMVATFTEVAAHAREHAAARGVPLRVAGNFFDCSPVYDPLVDQVDVLVTELRETRYQQPWYFRHGVGLARGKPLVAVENPYGGVIPQLLTRLRAGGGRDLFRTTIYEAAAMGATMALPYGSWLGTDVEDSYWAPHDLAVETGRFLRRIDPLLSPLSPHRTAVVFSTRSLFRATVDADHSSTGDAAFTPVVPADARPASYWETLEQLSRSGRAFDVVVLPDERLRPNDVTARTLARYQVVVLPDVWGISTGQHAQLLRHLDAGGRVVVHGAYGEELPDGQARRLLAHPGTIVAATVEEIAGHATADVVADLGPLAAVNLQLPQAGGVAVHLVNYDHDLDADRVRPRRELAVGVRWEPAVTRATLSAPGRDDVGLPVRRDGDLVHVVVPELATYAVVHLA